MLINYIMADRSEAEVRETVVTCIIYKRYECYKGERKGYCIINYCMER